MAQLPFIVLNFKHFFKLTNLFIIVPFHSKFVCLFVYLYIFIFFFGGGGGGTYSKLDAY